MTKRTHLTIDVKTEIMLAAVMTNSIRTGQSDTIRYLVQKEFRKLPTALKEALYEEVLQAVTVHKTMPMSDEALAALKAEVAEIRQRKETESK